MQYDIEADWMLLLTCNFRSPYCFIDPKLQGARIQRQRERGQAERKSAGDRP